MGGERRGGEGMGGHGHGRRWDGRRRAERRGDVAATLGAYQVDVMSSQIKSSQVAAVVPSCTYGMRMPDQSGGEARERTSTHRLPRKTSPATQTYHACTVNEKRATRIWQCL
jgi:hypothetical protein